MNVDNLRDNLRVLQNSIYTDQDNVILNNFLTFEKNLIIIGLTDDKVTTSLDVMKNTIYKEIIDKSTLFKETTVMDNYIEDYSIDYHKKNNIL